MPSLADLQDKFIDCLQKGPSHFPGEMFAETPDRALLGMKAHANTISHARLVALENGYPKLHEHLGHEQFHDLSRDYVEQDHIMRCDMNDIGAEFAEFLADRQLPDTAVELARIEWAWLESYHSGEAAALQLEDIAGLGEADLLNLNIDRHPAARLIRTMAPLSEKLAELGETAPHGLLIARPDAQVLFHTLEEAEFLLAKKLGNISTMGNFLEQAIELGDETTAMDKIIKLIRAGTLIRGNENEEPD